MILPSIFPLESSPTNTIPSVVTGPPIFTISLLYLTVKPIESKCAKTAVLGFPNTIIILS